MIAPSKPKNRARTASAASALRRQRETLEAAVEAALAVLDALDGDADSEDGGERETDADFELDVLDPDEVAGVAEARAEWGMGSGL